jgi:hypothetical protein
MILHIIRCILASMQASDEIQMVTAQFGVLQYSGAKDITMRTNRKWKIQDGGHQTNSMYISACKRDCTEISTTVPMFWGSINSTMLRTSLCEETESEK